MRYKLKSFWQKTYWLNVAKYISDDMLDQFAHKLKAISIKLFVTTINFKALGSSHDKVKSPQERLWGLSI